MSLVCIGVDSDQGERHVILDTSTLQLKSYAHSQSAAFFIKCQQVDDKTVPHLRVNSTFLEVICTVVYYH